MGDSALEEIANLLGRRNDVEVVVAEMIRRPMTVGHLGEWIASRIFDFKLERSAASAAIDGRFRAGPLAGKTVNIKWYLKRDGLRDISLSEILDYYLVLTGPQSQPVSSKGGTLPWRIDAVYLFNARYLHAELMKRGVKIGVATSVLNSQWEAAEIYPAPNNGTLQVGQEQVSQLRLLGP